MKTTNNLKDILTSKQFVKNIYTFPHPTQLLNPVIELFKKEEVIVMGSHSIQVAEDDKELTAFGRVGLISTKEIEKNINYIIGYFYSLEQTRPFLKCFAGISDNANLFIAEQKNIQRFDLTNSGTAPAFEKINEFLNDRENEISKLMNWNIKLCSQKISDIDIKYTIGNIALEFTKTKNIAGTSCILNACKLMTDKESIFSYENESTLWKVLFSLIDGFKSNTHIIDMPEKSLSIFNEIKKLIPNNG